VDEADLPYVFDRFFRGTGARGRQGSGLGLAIVRQVTEQHGGTVTAANAPDGGAVFRLHLPVVPADERARTGAGVEIS
jgi:two-component system sensor histidine kinase MprB